MDFKQDWQKRYELAVLETDWLAMEARITAVEAAIERRLNDLSQDHGGSPEENLSIVATTQNLSLLRGALSLWQASEGAKSDKRRVSEQPRKRRL